MGKKVKLITRVSKWYLNKLRGKRTPLYAGFFITNVCNFTCDFCNIAREKEKSKIDFEQFKRIIDSIFGDVRSSLNPTGIGAYFTNLALKPNLDADSYDIAEALRLYKPDSFEPGNPNSVGILEPEKANAYADLAIDTRAIFLDSTNQFPFQFVFPSTFLDFGLPGESSYAILVDKFGEKI